nr:gas vesicle structural domain protein [uncultured bacterium]
MVLDKGIVIDAFVRVSLVGIEVLTVEAKVVIASVDTYLRYAEKMSTLDMQPRQPVGVPQMIKDAKTGGALSGITDELNKGGGLGGILDDLGKSGAIDKVMGALTGGSGSDKKEEEIQLGEIVEEEPEPQAAEKPQTSRSRSSRKREEK